MDNLKPFLDLFGNLTGADIAKYSAYLLSFQLSMKVLAPLIKKGFDWLIIRVHETDGKEDDTWVFKLLSSKYYIAFSWVFDLLFRVKLPNESVFDDEPEVSKPKSDTK